MAVEAPDYFPTLSFCCLLCKADIIEMDLTQQYSRQCNQNRARLRTPDGVQWITVPLIGRQFGHKISETLIDYSDNWPRRHLKALRFNYGSSPFYEHYIPEIESLLLSRPETLGELTLATVVLTHKWLRGAGDLEVRESNTSALREVKKGSIRLQIHDRYYRPAEGTVCQLTMEIDPYRQNFPGFEAGLSALDLMFNYGPATKGMILEAVSITSLEDK